MVTVTMTPADTSSTDIEVLTDLSVTGKPAQFGRGVMQDVSDKLLGQFVACLEQRLATAEAEDARVEAPAEAAPLAAVPDAPTDEASGSPEPKVHHPLPHPPAHEEAIDLGSTVLPILAKAYWKQAVGAVIALLVLRRLFRRR